LKVENWKLAVEANHRKYTLRMRRASVLLIASAAAVIALSAAQAPSRPASSSANPAAIRLNNLGVATMNQQKFEPALKYFEQAVAADANLLTARVNEAIALINLQRYEPAKQLLTEATAADPQNVRAWYNLGLLSKSTGDAEQSLAAFDKAATLKPTDAHAAYFVGLMASQLQQYDRAVASFTRALSLDPFLVSAEFGLARAYQRMGKADEAHTHLERFQRLTTEKVAAAMSLSYGDQGPFSLAEALIPAGGKTTPAIPVTFAAAASPFPRIATVPGSGGLGAGGCFFDADGDGLIDYLALTPRATAPADAVALFKAAGAGRFERVASSGLTVSGTPIACTAADYDNDEKPDVAIASSAGVALFHNDGGHFSDVTAKAALSASPGVALGLSFVDFDHDGDADLIVPRAAAADAAGTLTAATADGPGRTLVWRNNGDGTFTEVSADRGLSLPGTSAALVATDFNNDRAVDLAITGMPVVSVLINPREGAFTKIAAEQQSASPTFGIVALDADKDGWMDLAVTHAGQPGLSVWHNAGGKALEPVAIPDLGLTRGWGVAALDYDNDGWMDLLAIGDAASGSKLVVLRNDNGTFVDQSAAAGASRLSLKDARTVVGADLDGDGDTDLVVTSADGQLTELRNDGGNANHAIKLTLKGLADNRSGVGTKVEVQAGTSWQKLETVAATGLFGQSSPDLLVGIGQEQNVDVVRLLWPTGVVQDEVDLPASKPALLEEVDRRGSSCPLVFTWNGHGYDFITDAVGPAVIGHWVAPRETNVADPDEYIRIEGRHLQARNGRLSLKYMEPMEEVNYLDQVRLIAVDHPIGTEMYPNEYFAATAPPPSAAIYGVRGAHAPAGAWDETGRDVLPELRSRDRRFVSIVDAPFRGFATLHALELDLGQLPANGPVRLLMTGFTDYFTATSMFAAHQARVDAVVPWLEAQRPDGTWTRVSDDIGFPAGLYRTMTADLTGKLPKGAHRIRIWTNLKVYWDEILVDTTPDGAVPLRVTTAPLLSGTLAFKGFPRETTGTPAADLRYTYEPVSQYGPWARHRGFYTRYGDVTPLLRTVEDQYVIFGAGEEISLDFDATALPPLPAGWTRDYLFYAFAYVKDMDFYGAYAQTVTPLPFAAMKTYPYAASRSYPSVNDNYLLEWNTREVATESWPSYRTRYPDAQ
jgi:tetratricopeptide (TPR) repeat protein